MKLRRIRFPAQLHVFVAQTKKALSEYNAAYRPLTDSK